MGFASFHNNRVAACQSWEDAECGSGPLGPAAPPQKARALAKTYRTDEAGVMPGMSQGFDELVPSLHGEVAAVTLGAEQSDVV